MTSLQKLQERTDMLKTVMEACPVPMALVSDTEDSIAHINSAFSRTFGYTQQDVTTLSAWWSMAFPDPEYRHHIAQRWQAHVDASNRHVKTSPVEGHIQCLDGLTRIVIGSTTSLGEDFGQYRLVMMIDITEQIASAHALADAHRLLQTVVDTIPMRIFWKDRASRFLGSNTLFAQDSGHLSPSDIIGKDDFDMAWHDQAERYRTDDQVVMASGTPRFGFEEPQTKADGSTMWLRTSKSPLRNENNEIIGILGTYEDVTDLKRKAEALRQAEERYRLLFEATPIPLCVIDDETHAFLAINEAALDQYGYTREESNDKSLKDIFFKEDYPKLLKFLAANLRHPKRISKTLVRHRKKNGDPIWLEVSAHPLTFEGRPARIFQGYDVTRRELAERDLRLAKEVIDKSKSAFFRIAKDGVIQYVNASACQHLGYTRDELIGMRPWDFDPDLSAETWPSVWEGLKRDKMVLIETRHRRKDGTIFPVQITGNHIQIGDTEYSFTFAQDISERKAAEGLLKKAEERYRLLFDATPVPLSVSDVETGKFLAVNNAALEQYGYTREESTRMNILDLIAPQDVLAVSRIVDDVRQGAKQIAHTIRRHKKKDGTLFWVQVDGHEIEFEGRRARIAQTHDITALIEATEQLRNAEERYRLLFDSSPVALSVFDAETGHFLAVNKAATEQYGYSKEEADRMTLQQLFLPEDLPKLAELHAEARNHPEEINRSAWRLRKKDGSLFWVEVDGHAIEYAGRPARIVQTHDITERMEMEQKIRSAEAQYRLLFEISPVPIGVFDVQTFEFLAFNDAALQLYGYTKEEAAKVSALDIYFPEDLPKFRAYLENEMRDPDHISLAVLRNRKKDGSAIWVEVKAHMVNYFGRTARIVQVNDITRRLQAEEELRKAEAHYRLLFEDNPVAMSIYDPVTLDFLAVNDAALSQYGYSREECLNMSVVQVYDAEELPRLKQFISEIDDHATDPVASTWKHRRKDGSTFWVQVSSQSIEYHGKAARLALAQDITEVKRSELREHTRSEVMDNLAKGAPLAHVLEMIALSVEQENPAALCSIQLLDDTGTHLKLGAAPSFPEFYNHAIDGIKIGQSVGSCGTAIATGMRVIVDDIQTHPFWTNYREVAAKADLASCWANPITAVSGKVIGSFSIYHHTPSTPTASDLELIEHATNLAGIAIERSLAGDALQLASLVYQNSGEAMVVTDAENHIIAINPAFTSVTGYTLEEVLGKDPGILSSERHDDGFYQSMWKSIHSTGQWQGEIWNRRKDGTEYAEWLTINSIYGDDGKVHRRVALFSDITDRKHAEALIWNQANFDTLTQLPNRRLFQDRLTQEVRKAHRDHEIIGLLFLDLDRFKEVNDTLGHHMGDELLIQAAQRIKQCIRESDSVARLGGDEFTVILPGLANVSDIGQIAQNIIETLSNPFRLGEDQAYISASIGITVYPDDAQTGEDLLKNADQAMYAAKRGGRNRYSYFTPSMQEAANMRMRLVRDIHVAHATNQFKVFYQPIVELASGRIHKAEALLRWNHPEQGFIGPAVFIPIAEDTGLIHDIGNWVFETTLKHLKCWRNEYVSNFQISINKSPVQFRAEGNIHERWIKQLRDEGLPGESVVIEITEGTLLNADAGINEKLLMFRDEGIQVAIDDFGTGYSSLSYLKKFDIDFLKIDQSFVQNLGADTSDLALSEAIIVMAHKLGLKVIAEGVETEAQRDILKSIGCDYAQGYLYSQAIPADAFQQLLEIQKSSNNRP